MQDWSRLRGAQVLAFARSVVGASPGGRAAAPELFTAASDDGPAFAEAHASILAIPAWAGAIGAIFLRKPLPSIESGRSLPDLLVAWIEPRPQPGPGFPSQLALDLPTGRYVISTYDGEKRLAVGSETACGTPLLCGPPFDGAALAVLVRPWPGPWDKVLDSAVHRQASRQPKPFSMASRP